jgi:hypothetical protein
MSSIVAGPALEQVVAAASVQDVVATFAAQPVGVGTPGDAVIKLGAAHRRDACDCVVVPEAVDHDAARQVDEDAADPPPAMSFP